MPSLRKREIKSTRGSRELWFTRSPQIRGSVLFSSLYMHLYIRSSPEFRWGGEGCKSRLHIWCRLSCIHNSLKERFNPSQKHKYIKPGSLILLCRKGYSKQNITRTAFQHTTTNAKRPDKTGKLPDEWQAAEKPWSEERLYQDDQRFEYRHG